MMRRNERNGDSIIVNKLIIDAKSNPHSYKLLYGWNEDAIESFLLYSLETVASIWIRSISTKEVVSGTLSQVRRSLEQGINTDEIQRELIDYYFIEVLKSILVDELGENLSERLLDYLEGVQQKLRSGFDRIAQQVETNSEEVRELAQEIAEAGERILVQPGLVGLPLSIQEEVIDRLKARAANLCWETEQIDLLREELENLTDFALEDQQETNMLVPDTELINQCDGLRFTLGCEDGAVVTVTVATDWEVNENMSNPSQSPYRLEDLLFEYLRSQDEGQFHLFLFSSRESMFDQYQPLYQSENFLIASSESLVLQYALDFAKEWLSCHKAELVEEEPEEEEESIQELIESSVKKWLQKNGILTQLKKIQKETGKLLGSAVKLQSELVKSALVAHSEAFKLRLICKQVEDNVTREAIDSSLKDLIERIDVSIQ